MKEEIIRLSDDVGIKIYTHIEENQSQNQSSSFGICRRAFFFAGR